MPYIACPKCGQRPPQAIGDREACPACGVYMHKWRSLQTPPAVVVVAPDAEVDDAQERWWLRIADTEPVLLGARAALLAFLGVWGGYLALLDIADGEINNSFMHRPLLVFHEAGHVLFMPLGEFMTVAGGSLFQVILPLAIGVASLCKNRDPYGAALCLWWCGISLIDVAPYIYDALYPQLMLLSGTTGEDGPHDWIYLLDRLGLRAQAQGWGRFIHGLGSVVSLVALAWAAACLWVAYRAPRHD